MHPRATPDSEPLLQLLSVDAPLDLVLNSGPSRRSGNPDHKPNPTYKAMDNEPLHVMLGNVIGSGFSGVIFEALVIDQDARRQLPTLLAKVSRHQRRGHMAREKWMYDELWPLQGVAIPHCYGWFETEIEPSEDVWGRSLNISLSSDIAPAGPLSPPPRGLNGNNDGKDTELPLPWSNTLDAFAAVTDRISILLIERVGDRLLQGDRHQLDQTMMYVFFLDLYRLEYQPFPP